MDREEAKKVLVILKLLKAHTEIDKILSTFITAFKQQTSSHGIENMTWLHGSFNLGGTKSGRLSSSNPNLQQIPSTGSIYAKQIKKCFRPPPGYLIVGADFSALEDRISALITRDPNKLKVYTDGYDSHCLRSYAYFKDQMSDITYELNRAVTKEDRVNIINSIQTRYPHLRQQSKTATFALTYNGTWRTLVQNGGLSEKAAKSIEKGFHDLYKGADNWTWKRIHKASKRGYSELAFGLRLRTPLLEKSVVKSQTGLLKEAHKEIKTVANAHIQSYGMLNLRACNDFMQRVWDSEFRELIQPICQIHDAIYLCIKNRIDVLHFVNKNLIECMTWDDLPELQHPSVKLEAQLEIYTPDWSKSTKVPNNLTMQELADFLVKSSLREPLWSFT